MIYKGLRLVVTVGLEPTSATDMVATARRAARFLSVEKEFDEIPATGGHRILSPVDVNDVLCLYGMFASQPQELVVINGNFYHIPQE